MGVIMFMWFRIPSQEINSAACNLLKHKIEPWLIGESLVLRGFGHKCWPSGGCRENVI